MSTVTVSDDLQKAMSEEMRSDIRHEGRIYGQLKDMETKGPIIEDGMFGNQNLASAYDRRQSRRREKEKAEKFAASMTTAQKLGSGSHKLGKD